MKLLFIIGLFFMPICLNAQKVFKQTISITQCKTIVIEGSDVTLHIAPNTFINQDDALINENISVELVLYKDYYDMLFADIPMHDSNGNYISGGMFDITFKSNNIPLKFIKEVTVEYVADETDYAVYKGYQLDKVNNTWNELNVPVLNYATNVASDAADWGSSPISTTPEIVEGWDDEDCWCGEEADGLIAVAKTLGIKSNGLYNYDYIIDNEDFVPLLVKVSTEIKRIYVHYKGLNTLLYYDVEDTGSVKDFGFLNSVQKADITVFYKMNTKRLNQIVIGKMTNNIDRMVANKNTISALVFEINQYPVQKSSFKTKFEAK
ncbi:hypothetical protein EI427_23025 [Flammeovirga pectinis]|uniref:Uncharacterized protein n=1 Tax=Flammeovirga pectinis TaxID=2494373 RepID=A0A3S9PAJ6_9BACT|nr:hypothetical protein [Flammeovirga pectinis]AZQ65092.1 hypothetical protein EI427_23025 [Flammeovirga pectinis]